MKKIILAALVFSSTLHSAVKISSNGTGEAILVPFYTVANGLHSNLMVINTSEKSKLSKIVIRDNKNSEHLISFNVFLKGHDSWTAALAQVDGKATLISNDGSCSQLPTPAIQSLFPLAVDPDEQLTEEQLQLRMEVGTIEIYELATIRSGDNPINTATNEFDCSYLADQYFEGGLLAEGADVDAVLTSAENSLRATVGVFDVLNGYSFTVPVIHFKDFFADDTFKNEQPHTDRPNLSDANNISQFSDENGLHEIKWDQGYMAISALLMKSMIGNDFVLESSVAAATEWVITLPTLKYHLNDRVEPFIQDSGTIRFPYPILLTRGEFHLGFKMRDREGKPYPSGCSVLCPPSPLSDFGHSINVLFANYYSFAGIGAGEHITSNIPLLTSLDNENTYEILTHAENGKIELYVGNNHFSTSMTGHYIKNNEVFKLQGLPAIGFSVQRFINGNAQPGLLANYATATPHYWKRQYSTEQ